MNTLATCDSFADVPLSAIMATLSSLTPELISLIVKFYVKSLYPGDTAPYRIAGTCRLIYNAISPILYEKLVVPKDQKRQKLLIRTLYEHPRLAKLVEIARVPLRTTGDGAISKTTSDENSELYDDDEIEDLAIVALDGLQITPNDDGELDDLIVVAYENLKLATNGRQERLEALREGGGNILSACILLMLPNLKRLSVQIVTESKFARLGRDETFSETLQDAIMGADEYGNHLRHLAKLEEIELGCDMPEYNFSVPNIEAFLHIFSLKTLTCWQMTFRRDYQSLLESISVEVLELREGGVDDWDAFLRPFKNLKSLTFRPGNPKASGMENDNTADGLWSGLRHVKATLESLDVAYLETWCFGPPEGLQAFPRLRRVVLPLATLIGVDVGGSTPNLVDVLPNGLEELLVTDLASGRDRRAKERPDAVEQMVDFVLYKKARFPAFASLTIKGHFGDIKILREVCENSNIKFELQPPESLYSGRF